MSFIDPYHGAVYEQAEREIFEYSGPKQLYNFVALECQTIRSKLVTLELKN